MGLVLLSAQPPYFISFTGAPLAAVSFVVSLVYTFVLLSYLLNASGDWIGNREDL
jgi:hypothetical protein